MSVPVTESGMVLSLSPMRSPYNEEEASLEEGHEEDLFRGATLQISQDGLASGASRSPASTPGAGPALGSESARLPLSDGSDGMMAIGVERVGGHGAGTLEAALSANSLRPAVSSGLDAVSPIGTLELGGSSSLPSSPTKPRLLLRRRSSQRAQSPMPPANESEAREFFTYRDQLVQAAIQEVSGCLLTLPQSPQLQEPPPYSDRSIRGAWLLTEIDHWDHEKERLVLVGDQTLFVVKYDFIALRQLETRQIPLHSIDHIVRGELTYPEASLVPRLNGIAGGLVSVVRDGLVRRVQDTMSSVAALAASRQQRSRTTDDLPDATKSLSPSPLPYYSYANPDHHDREPLLSYFTYHNFQPRSRNVQGVRAMWNKGERLPFRQRWNPFSKAIPWVTFASHPLLWCKGGESNRLYDVEVFGSELGQAIEDLEHSGESRHVCQVEHRPIVIENYVGLTSLIHNTNDLGFFKVRGKVSF